MDYGAATLDRIVSSVWRTDDFGRLMGQLERYLPSDDLPSISAAYEFSAKAHQGQQRRNGDPYISHPVAVAEILAGLHLDSGSIKAALLHDVVEDTASTLPEIQERFGDDVALLVDGVSKIDHLKFDSAAEAQAESFRKMLLAMAKDLRVILVKLADRTHNMRTIQSLAVEKQRRIARETLDIYAPIANRLGVYSIKLELEDLGFKTFYPYPLQSARAHVAARERQPAPAAAQDRVEAHRSAGGRQDRRARRGAREASLQHLSQDAAQAGAPVGHRRRLRRARHRRRRRPVLSRARASRTSSSSRCRAASRTTSRFRASTATSRCTRRCSGRTACRSRCRSAPKSMDKVAERGIAAHWQYKAARQGHAQHGGARARMAGRAHGDGARGELRGIPRDRQGGSVPRQGLRVHAEGRDPAAAARRDGRRFRVRGAHRRRQSLRGREDRSARRAAEDAAAKRRDGRDRHAARRAPEPELGQFRDDGEGAQRDPRLPQEPEARRGARARPAAHQSGALVVLVEPEEGAEGAARAAAEGARHRRRGRVARAGRLGRAVGARRRRPARRKSATSAMRLRPRSASRSRSPARKAPSSATRTAAIRFPATRSSASCRAAAASSSIATAAETSPSTASSRRSGFPSTGRAASRPSSSRRFRCARSTASACSPRSPGESRPRTRTSSTCASTATATRRRSRSGSKVRDRRQLAQVVRSIRTIPGVVRVSRSAS